MNMLVKQSKNSFIRCTDKYGYITNQLTRHDRVYDETGADWLREISRVPQDVNDILTRVISMYYDGNKNEISKDFYGFINSLERDKFIVTGNTPAELDRKDLDFSYSMENPKTLETNFYQETRENTNTDTQSFFLEEVQGEPKIQNLQFELSSRCNERCIHCYIPNDKKDHGNEIPLEKVKSIIDEFADMGGLHVTLSGGEAFLHKNFIEIVQYCREKDLMISILSNLTLLKDSDIPILKKANVSLIQASLYSMKPEEHDFITTVKGSFVKTKNAIEKLVKADIPVQISCPVMKANRHSYCDVLDYAKSLKVKAQTDFIMMARADLETDNLANRLSLDETEELLRDIILHDSQYTDKTLKLHPISEEYKLDPEKFKSLPVCGVGYDNCCIAANGDVYPCAGWQGYVIGNVYRQSLQEIWANSDKVKQLRKITNASFPQCLKCEARDYCSSCLVRNFNESGGDMFKINKHFCDVAFLNKRLVEELVKN